MRGRGPTESLMDPHRDRACVAGLKQRGSGQCRFEDPDPDLYFPKDLRGHLYSGGVLRPDDVTLVCVPSFLLNYSFTCPYEGR